MGQIEHTQAEYEAHLKIAAAHNSRPCKWAREVPERLARGDTFAPAKA